MNRAIGVDCALPAKASGAEHLARQGGDLQHHADESNGDEEGEDHRNFLFHVAQKIPSAPPRKMP
jgi:hypothetical protein